MAGHDSASPRVMRLRGGKFARGELRSMQWVFSRQSGKRNSYRKGRVTCSRPQSCHIDSLPDLTVQYPIEVLYQLKLSHGRQNDQYNLAG
jgi:hypothetical protein